MILVYILLLVLGLVMLFIGGDWLVKGASRFSLRLGISVMVVGLTVVAFGTSAPEFIVSLLASIRKEGSVAIGNIVGSNIANIALVLGVSALIKPIKIQTITLRQDVPWMLAAAFLFLIVTFMGKMGRMWGAAFLILFSFFLYGCFRKKRDVELPVKETSGTLTRDVLLIVAGLALLLAGGEVVVSNAVALAKMMKVSELIIAATIVALGTSLPELMTSLVASLKGEQDIAVGNVIGSNIFNILWVLGFCALITPFDLQSKQLGFHNLVMIIFSLLCLPIMHTGKTISRTEGLFMVFGYILYIVLLYAFSVSF
ncbi:MAG: calcium/sodium antiporter [Candidatus Aureabacteria bacterium]|nr:calcium/sodium antiporter [Candidatus Auribacterota bacterium]